MSQSDLDLRSLNEGPLDLQTWRTRLLNGMLFAAAGLGLPAIISGSITAVRDGQLTRIIIFGVAFTFILILAFVRKRLPYTLRAVGLLIIVFGLGADSLRSTGLPGSGRIFMIAFAVIGTLLFGLRGGLISLGIALASTAAVGWGMSTAALPFSMDVMASTDPRSWLTGGVVFTLLASMLVVSLGILQRGLSQSLGNQHALLQTFEEQQERLERRVVERTAELQRQSTQLEATAEIARLTAETEHMDDLLDRAVKLIQSRFNFYHVSIFLLDPTNSWAEVAASTGEAGQLLLSRRHRLAVGSASIVGWVSANRLPRVSPDVEQDPFFFRNPSLPETKAEMALPLMVGQRLIGVLDLQSSDLGAFSEAGVRVVEAIASELAFAIENAQLMEERREQLSTLETEVRDRIRSSWSDYARTAGPSIIHVGGGASGASEASFTGISEASLLGSTYLSEDKTEVAVPVRVRGETIATIAARKSEEGDTWTDDDVALLESVAGQAALALETARQYAEEQRRVTELEVVNRVSQAASQLMRLDTLVRMVGRQIYGVVSGEHVAIAMYNEEQDMLDYSYVLELGEEVNRPSAAATEGLAGVVVRSRQPLLLDENVEQQAAGLGVRLEQKPPASWLGVPLLVGDRLVGLIIVQDYERARSFSEDDVALLSTVAGQMATALQNTQLLEQVQRTARRERLIHEISSKVRQSPDIETVLETTAREVGRALNATRATVKLGHPAEEEEDEAEQPTAAGQEGRA
jgi:GAF domain-containing protein